MNPRIASLLFSGIFFAFCSAGQDARLPKQPDFASFLIANGDADAAGLEYERVRAAGLNDSAALTCMLGELYLKTDAAKAEFYFNEASEAAPPGSALMLRADQGLILAYLLERKSLLAENELAGFIKRDSGSHASSTCSFLACAIDASLYRVDSARIHLPHLLTDSVYSQRTALIGALLDWYRKQELRHPLYTYVYSTAVPGWGQWYNKDKKGAVAALGLMATLSGIIGWEGYRFYRGDLRQRYVCGMDIFLVAGLLWRRYHGSIRKAAYNETLMSNATIQLEYQRRLRSILCMKQSNINH